MDAGNRPQGNRPQAHSPQGHHPLAMTPPGVWLRVVRENGGVSPAYRGKLASLLLGSALMSPLRAWETLRYGRAVARTRIAHPPLFILGFARTGTTHLHNLLAQDPALGVVTTFQAAMPTFYLTARSIPAFRRFLTRNMPPTRPMDNVAIALDLPQEEEIAVANTSHLSYVHHLSFPARLRDYIERYALMRGLTPAELAQWEQVYLNVLRKATLAAGGRRLALKSPNNTGRVSHLLRLFPDARFVHITRSPYAVYRSVLHTYRAVLPISRLQDCPWETTVADFTHCYAAVMRQYLDDRAQIPAGRLSETRFEDLEQNPLAELERIYRELSLPGWNDAKPAIAAYLGDLAGYRRNAYDIDPAIAETVEREWAFALDEWGYRRP